MLNANIVDHIGSKVTVWTKDGNAAESRQLYTVDEFGIVISNQHGKRTFIPWCRVKYVDYEDVKKTGQLLSENISNSSKRDLSSYSKRELFEELKLRTSTSKEEIRIHNDMDLEVCKVNKDGQLRGNTDVISGPATIFIYNH